MKQSKIDKVRLIQDALYRGDQIFYETMSGTHRVVGINAGFLTVVMEDTGKESPYAVYDSTLDDLIRQITVRGGE